MKDHIPRYFSEPVWIHLSPLPLLFLETFNRFLRGGVYNGLKGFLFEGASTVTETVIKYSNTLALHASEEGPFWAIVDIPY